ncbi:MAG: RrF2 family transcriptional regulator [Dehalococcoidia bacterium]
MHMSRSLSYAIYGMSHLAMQPPDRLVALSEIAGRFNLPEKHLAKIFQHLAKTNLVYSKRGAPGGFCLARKPSEITLLEIVEAVEGPIDVEGCLIADGKPCVHEPVCSVAAVLRRVQGRMVEALRELNLEELGRTCERL